MEKQSALNTQVDGNHYKNQRIQPIELAYLVGGTPCFCKLAKYGSRNKVSKAIDLTKALHCVNIERELFEKAPHSLEENYPQQGWASYERACAWIDVFTDDVIFRAALKDMWMRNYDSAAILVEDMMKEAGVYQS